MTKPDPEKMFKELSASFETMISCEVEMKRIYEDNKQFDVKAKQIADGFNKQMIPYNEEGETRRQELNAATLEYNEARDSAVKKQFKMMNLIIEGLFE